MVDETVAAFHLFRLSLARFGYPPDRLDGERLAELRPAARKAAALEDSVLASDMAAGLSGGDGDPVARMGEAETACGGAMAFGASLAALGLDRTAFAAGAARELRFDRVMRRVADTVADPTEAEIAAYFAAHPERFRVAERRTARHILITINPAYPENERPRSLRRIRRLADRLAETPAAFDDLARTHSECPTALEGGLLGTVPRGVLYPGLDAALFALPAGGVGGPIETSLGFHVVRCDAIYPGCMPDLAEVAPAIREALRRAGHRMAWRSWLASIERG